ncbi:Kynurenine formamidase [Modestobacter sp. DSM 44400]|uniref:cyclase family protein n=1 Tax=Modestobacter sp. DSM 44400 TaxID=1550230 RepID=UPI00089AF2B0|nr:cyclase family protein [Modestobacter sp. DSM 44400]SDX99895.1 Kynurenine formamidase [Modestobacter sp. DSM 44400]
MPSGFGNWGRWGADDEAGALNLVDPAAVLAATDLVREGRVVSLAQPLGPQVPVPPHRRAPQRFMDRDAGDYAAGARAPDGFRFAEDTVQLSTHSGTHLDALAHAWSGDTLYNGHPASAVRSTRGAQRCGAEKLRPAVTRGVLVDLVAGHGGPLPARTPVNAAMLSGACSRAGVEPHAGDAVLLRTGWWEQHLGAVDYFDNEPGLDDDAAAWLAARDVAIVGADNYAVEVQPSAPGSTFPVHLTLLHRHGVPLLENLELRELAATGRTTFLLVVAPLPLAGSTGSPVNPVAVL